MKITLHGLRANREWLMENRERYRGHWVALRDGELLGHEKKLSELLMKVKRDESILYVWA